DGGGDAAAGFTAGSCGGAAIVREATTSAAPAPRDGRTSASRRFLASVAKLPLGYLSRYARMSSGRFESRTLTQNSRSMPSVMSALGPLGAAAVRVPCAVVLN